MSENEIHPLVLEAEELYHDYEAYHDIWAEQAQMNRDYVYNKQWSEDEVEELQKRNQAPLVVNRIFPAIDAKMAIMAAKNPGVRVTGREDSDNKVARIFEDIMQYCWQISDGDSLYAQALADSLITGLGYMYVYVDKYADGGLGEVKFGYADPDDIYIDPTSKDPLCRDAESILIVKHITKRQAKLRYPQYQEIIDAAETSIEKQRGGSMHADEGQIVGRDMVDIKKEKVRIIERYYKTIKNFVRFVDESGEIQVLPEEEFNAINEGVAESPTSEGNIDILGYVYVPRIRVSGIVGSDLLYDVELPIEDYPIVPFCNVYTGTPYGMGEPAFLMGQQDMLNKLYSLMIAHTQTSTNPKVFVEKGSVEDIDQFRIEYSKPGAVMEYMPGVTPPKDIPPVPLSNALFSLAADMKYETEYSSGVFPLMQGSSQGAPETFRGTLAIEEFGNRRIMLKMKTVERALTQLFKQAVTLAQTVYTTHKIFRLIQPNGLEISQEANIPIYDDAGEVIQRINDLSVGKYDIIVLAGSTLPSNRWALAQEYMQWYQAGLVDDVEVLKKLDIFDRDGVMKRKALVMQQAQHIQQLTATLEDMAKQLDKMKKREVTYEKKIEIEKFKAHIDSLLADLEGKTDVINATLRERLRNVQKELEKAIREKEKGKPQETNEES